MLRRPVDQYFSRFILLLVLFSVTLVVPTQAWAAGGFSSWDEKVRDSLFSLAADANAIAEPTIQEILDSFGYDINAETDAVELDLFCLFPQSTWKLIAEYSGAANTHEAGWYRSLVAGDTHTVLTGAMVPGDSAIITGASGDLHGIFQRRDQGTTWYTQLPLNYDQKGHHKTYPLPGGAGYLIFWEDLGWVTDGDYNDMVFEVRPENQAPTLGVDYSKACGGCPPQLICVGDSACLEITVSDFGCFGDTVTLEMVTGEGEFIPITGTGEFTAIHCWVPVWEGTKHFVFRATDNLGQSTEKEFWANIGFYSEPPVLPPPVFADTTGCLPLEICLDFSIEDTSYTELWVRPIGYYDEIEQQVCFDADTAGSYTIWIVAADTCGNIDSTYLNVTVGTTSPPVITAILENHFDICGSDSLCVSFSVFDPDHDVVSIWTDAPGLINFADSTLCFVAESPGTFEIPLYVIDACDYSDTALVVFKITGGGEITIDCPGTIEAQLCESGEVCFPLNINGGSSGTTVTVSPNGSYNPQTGEVCLPNLGAGTFEITLIAADDCDADTCTTLVTVTLNNPPVVNLPDDFERFYCTPPTICVPYSCLDIDGNLLTCEVLEAPIGFWLDNGDICFDPVAAGTYRIIVRAEDDCGAIAVDTVVISVLLNTPPEIVGDEATSVGLCGPGEVCLPLDVLDIDDNIFNVLTDPNASYNELDGEVCFWADTSGSYQLRLIAVDECDAADTLEMIITVGLNELPPITCPEPTETMLCGPGQVCLPLTLPVVSGGLTVVVEPLGVYDELNEQICFDADTAGHYELSIIASDTCGSADTCLALVAVTFNRPPEVTGESGLEFFLCTPEEICIPVSCFDPDGNLTDCELVYGPGTYDGNEICFLPTESGRINFKVRATDACGEKTELALYVITTFNEKPLITAPETISTLICEPQSVCIEYSATDPEGRPLTITSSAGTINPGENTLCVYFQSDSSLCVEIYATDSCGASDTALVCFEIDLNQPPQVNLEAEFAFDLCSPGEVCFPIEILETEGVNGTEIKPFGVFNADSTTVCFDADTAGTYQLTVIVTDVCFVADTATTRVTVTFNAPPTLSVPADQEIFICAVGEEVCLSGITAVDPDGNLTSVEITAGSGQLNMLSGELCFTPDAPGGYCFELTATDDCLETDVDTICVTITTGEPPVITLQPQLSFVVAEPSVICFPIASDDPDPGQLFDLQLTSGLGPFVPLEGYDHLEAEHCFLADTSGCYPFVFASTDSCGLFDIESTLVCVTIIPPDTTYRICIDTIQAINGRNVNVDLIVYEAMEMGGFDFLICFDISALSFVGAEKGATLADWEYYTYRLTTPAGCVSPCNADAIRLIGIADMNNGTAHPPEEAYLPVGVFTTLTFFVTEDRSFIGQCIPLTFCWYDCGDNTISSRSGDTTYVSRDIEMWLPDEDCLTGYTDKGVWPEPRIDFCDGRICIIPPPDDRGDINLNGIANEVGDAVLFTNYFIWGNSVWDPVYFESQWLATDINDDGLLKSIADLVYLIRIITGDAQPFPASGEGGRIAGSEYTVTLDTRFENGELILSCHTPVDLGGLFVRFVGDFTDAGTPEFNSTISALQPKHRLTDGGARLLVAPMAIGAAIPAGTTELMRLSVGEMTGFEIVEMEAATYFGVPVVVELAAQAGVPRQFELLQNYPNPFNAGTMIRFTLPEPAVYNLTIYDVAGRRVRKFRQTADAGPVNVFWEGNDHSGRQVSSGIYFYRVTAGEHQATRKMVLVK